MSKGATFLRTNEALKINNRAISTGLGELTIEPTVIPPKKLRASKVDVRSFAKFFLTVRPRSLFSYYFSAVAARFKILDISKKEDPIAERRWEAMLYGGERGLETNTAKKGMLKK